MALTQQRPSFMPNMFPATKNLMMTMQMNLQFPLPRQSQLLQRKAASAQQGGLEDGLPCVAYVALDAVSTALSIDIAYGYSARAGGSPATRLKCCRPPPKNSAGTLAAAPP